MPELSKVVLMPTSLASCVTGVYVIVNIINGKRYFGSSSKSVYRRLHSHRNHLRAGTHVNRHLQSAWNKYGEDAFVFKLVEECCPEECIIREQGYIDHYNTANDTIGYNISPTAGSTLGRVGDQENRDKISQLHKRLWADADYRAKMMLLHPEKEPDDLADVVNRYIGGETCAQIAKSLNSCIETVRRWITYAGVDIRPGGRKRMSDKQIQEMVDGYVTGETISSLARRFDTVTKVVRKKLVESGVVLRQDIGRNQYS